MAPLLSIELDAGHQRSLLTIARQSIGLGLQGQPAPDADATDPADPLSARLGTFVTLTLNDALRGCIGSLQSSNTLPRSVAEAAYNAAFHDPRFPRLAAHELPGVQIEVSVLSAMSPIAAETRDELLQQLRPGRDGLLLQDGHYRSTFLPKVWEQLAEPGLFLDQLLAKAGLPASHWSGTLRFQRYETLSFREPAQSG